MSDSSPDVFSIQGGTFKPVDCTAAPFGAPADSSGRIGSGNFGVSQIIKLGEVRILTSKGSAAEPQTWILCTFDMKVMRTVSSPLLPWQ